MMNISNSIQQGRFLLLLPKFFSFQGVCKLACVRNLRQSQGIRKGFSKNMAWSMERCDLGLDVKIGVVHPATDAYAAEAVEALKAGKVIAVPTDTLYGFACDACSLEAINRIYEIKGRKHTSPLAICAGDVSDINRFALTDHLPHGLLDSLLPGPVTVVLRRGESSALERSLNPGFDSIGVRVPDCNFIRLIARGSGTALALTSANLSGQPSSVCIKDFEKLWEHCASVYDGGLLPSGRAGSTVVDLSTPYKYKILRPGRINVIGFRLELISLEGMSYRRILQLTVMCEGVPEALDHLFLNCVMARDVWAGILRWLGFVYHTPPDLFVHWKWWNELSGNKKIRKGYRIIWHAAIWTIWRVRNDLIFNNSTCGIEEVVEAIKALAWRWVLNRLNLPACMFYEWNWNSQDCLLR